MNVEHMSNSYITAVYFPHLDCKVEVTHRVMCYLWIASGVEYHRTPTQLGFYFCVKEIICSLTAGLVSPEVKKKSLEDDIANRSVFYPSPNAAAQ